MIPGKEPPGRLNSFSAHTVNINLQYGLCFFGIIPYNVNIIDSDTFY